MTHNPIPKKTLYALYDKICETLEDKDSRTQLIKSLQYSRYVPHHKTLEELKHYQQMMNEIAYYATIHDAQVMETWYKDKVFTKTLYETWGTQGSNNTEIANTTEMSSTATKIASNTEIANTTKMSSKTAQHSEIVKTTQSVAPITDTKIAHHTEIEKTASNTLNTNTEIAKLVPRWITLLSLVIAKALSRKYL